MREFSSGAVSIPNTGSYSDGQDTQQTSGPVCTEPRLTLFLGEVRQGELIVVNYSCAHAALVESRAQLGERAHPEHGPNVMRHEVVVDIQGQGQLRVDLDRRSLDHSQAVRVQLRATCRHTCTHTRTFTNARAS